MSDQFVDNFNVPITYISLQQAEATDSSAAIVKVLCIDGSWLAADDDPYVRIRARINGSGDPYVDLATDPIDLSPFAGIVKVFDIIVRTESIVEGVISRAVQIRRTLNP